jgi:hypothetical protein
MGSPWLSIWVEPRRTIQAIVDRDPKFMVLPLAALAGIGEALDRASLRHMLDEVSLATMLLVCLLGGIFAGIVGLYLYAFLARVSGTSGQLRAALAWASVPMVAALLVWLPEAWLFGRDLFTAAQPRIDANPLAFLGLTLLELALGVWSLVLACKTIGQVHGFSAWRGAATMLISVLLVVVPLFLLVYGAMSLGG